MGVSWGTQWGYVVSTNPSKCAVFCKDKRPSAIPSTDELGNETVDIGSVPKATTTARVVLVDSEREAYVQAKLAQYESLIPLIQEYANEECEIKLRTERNNFQLRMDKQLDEAQRDELEQRIAEDQKKKFIFMQAGLELLQLKRTRVKERELEDIWAESDDPATIINAIIAKESADA